MFGLSADILFFIALGIALFIVEILTLTFYAFFLSLAAFVVALCLYATLSLTAALIIGGLVAVGCCIVFQRGFQKKRFQPSPPSPFAHLVGQKGTVSEGIDAQSLTGTVIIDGTAWRATADCAIAEGERVVVMGAGISQSMTVVVEKYNH